MLAPSHVAHSQPVIAFYMVIVMERLKIIIKPVMKAICLQPCSMTGWVSWAYFNIDKLKSVSLVPKCWSLVWKPMGCWSITGGVFVPIQSPRITGLQSPKSLTRWGWGKAWEWTFLNSQETRFRNHWLRLPSGLKCESPNKQGKTQGTDLHFTKNGKYKSIFLTNWLGSPI